MKLLRYFELWIRHLGIELSREMAYKVNFFFKFFALVLVDIIGPVFTILLYSTTSGIPGWRFEEFILFQGTFALVFGLGHMLTILLPVHVIHAVRKGNFDKFLTKPFPPLINVLTSCWDLEALGEVMTGIALVTWAIVKLQLFNTNLLWYLLLVFVGFLFHLFAMILISSLSFLVVQSWALMDIFFKLSDFARYPSTLYSAPLQVFVNFLFPISVAAFFPADALLNGLSFMGFIKIALPVAAFGLLSILLWNAAMKKYTSAGG